MAVDVPTCFLEGAVDSIDRSGKCFGLDLRQVGHTHIGLIALRDGLE